MYVYLKLEAESDTGLYLDFLECNQLSIQQVCGFVDLTELAPTDFLFNSEVCQSAAILTAWDVFLQEKNSILEGLIKYFIVVHYKVCFRHKIGLSEFRREGKTNCKNELCLHLQYGNYKKNMMHTMFKNMNIQLFLHSFSLSTLKVYNNILVGRPT